MGEDADLALLQLLWTFQTDFERCSDELVMAADSMARRMGTRSSHVDDGMTVNTLGEVQGSGSSLDRLCALRGEAISNVKRVAHTLNALGVEIDESEVL